MTIDRPGHGLSDFQPGRTLLDWPQDVDALSDHLGIDRFAVSGWSAGGAYGLAYAYRIPERLTAVGLISSFGPYDRAAATAGMDRSNKMALAIARRMPWAVTRRVTAVMGRSFAKDPEASAQRRFASSPAPDREAMSDPQAADMLLASMVELFRAGSDGSAWEVRLLTRPWGFALHDIAVPVALWHGDADINSPLAAASYLSRAIPGRGRLRPASRRQGLRALARTRHARPHATARRHRHRLTRPRTRSIPTIPHQGATHDHIHRPREHQTRRH